MMSACEGKITETTCKNYTRHDMRRGNNKKKEKENLQQQASSVLSRQLRDCQLIELVDESEFHYNNPFVTRKQTYLKEEHTFYILTFGSVHMSINFTDCNFKQILSLGSTYFYGC